MGVTYTTAAANTYVPIATYTIPTATSSYTFSSISSAYTDLVLVHNAASSTNDEIYVKYNSIVTGYSSTELWANGTNAYSQRATSETQITLRNASATVGNNMAIMQIFNYANTTTSKTALIRINDGYYNRIYSRVALCSSTAAISSLIVSSASGNLVAGSTFSLYGILAA